MIPSKVELIWGTLSDNDKNFVIENIKELSHHFGFERATHKLMLALIEDLTTFELTTEKR